MKSVCTGLGVAIALAAFCPPASAGQSPSGWKWDAPPPAATSQRPEPLQAPPKPDCAGKDANRPECAAAATTTDDGLENSLAPPSQMGTSGNRRAKKTQ